MKTLYDMIAEAVKTKAEAEKFLNNGLADKTLMRLNNGTIRPRYCQYCAEEYGRNVVPKMQGWEFNLSEKDLEIIRKAGKPEWDHFWQNVSSKLKQNGYDTSRCGLCLPMLANGRQYACFCDCCGLCSGWYLTQQDAMNEFDRIVQEQIKYSREKGGAE